jgi:pheromone shutdown protein TraB
MNSPLFNALGNNQMTGLVQRFQQFQKTFQGDPRQQIQQMLNSGRVSQAQYNQAVQQAQQLARMLGINPGAQG